MAAETDLNCSPLPGISLRVEGDRAAVRHLRSEYTDAAPRSGEPAVAELTVRFVRRLAVGARRGGHKTVHWSAQLERSGPRNLTLSILLRGRPRWFGLSLVQGYLIEPALSLLAVDASGVLLPAAALVVDGSALLLVGRSGTGKSSIALRSLAAGIPLIGDDQVFVGADGICTRFPRRLRLYDDARQTAPAAVGRLPSGYRLGLQARRVVRIGSRSLVAPSLAVPTSAVRGAAVAASAPLGRVVLLSRRPGIGELASEPANVAEALDRSAEVITDQRARLDAICGEAWRQEFVEVARRERGLLERAFTSLRISRLEVPSMPTAATAITAMANELGLTAEVSDHR